MTLINSIAAIKDEITAYRRELHQNPQTAYEENFASDLVAKKLTEWGIPFKRGYGVTGIVATIEGQKTDSGKAIGLRADMDALNMTEQSGQPWASKNPGKMHGCGHDGHTAMLLGAAKYLSETRNFNGKVHLIFQPAEEGAGGGERMIEEGLLKDFPMNAAFAIHNWPTLPIGIIGLCEGPIMASTDSFEITLTGKGGHAAMPHLNNDPIIAGAQLVAALQSVVSRQVDPLDNGVISITNFKSGTGAHNVTPDSALLMGTYRSLRVETRALLQRRINEITESTAKMFNVTFEISYRDGCDPTINTPAEVALCAKVASDILGEKNVQIVKPAMTGDDFGAILQSVPGCYFWMGQGVPGTPHEKGLHNSGYDFNDDIIPTGIEFWARLAETALPLTK
ncbi:MAG: amidohydrolase [Micavibrio aeruginosavorus]|uniref:Amidohydrolase n=1 Tax=Micavibrio aeruginosavorus TaxID=349221 RepID=A0A2W5N9E1_9BACT|nr:MAG: amidohydrolase [Micavibrio aeruginosavorus]